MAIGRIADLNLKNSNCPKRGEVNIGKKKKKELSLNTHNSEISLSCLKGCFIDLSHGLVLLVSCLQKEDTLTDVDIIL